MSPKFQVQLKIRKPVAEVFEAVVDPGKLAGYFVQKASGRLASGKTVKWKFAELDEEFDVVVHEVVANQRIVLEWESEERGYNTRVEMTFKPLDAGSTLVQIAESGWRDTEKGVAASYSNCSGWTHMLLCLKGFLEYQVNLRAGGVA